MSTPEDIAAILILFIVADAITLTLVLSLCRAAAREPDWPPEWEPDLEPDEDGVYADARAEMDQWWTELEERDGNA